MKVRDRERALIEGLQQSLQNCHANGISLPGIADPVAKDVFVAQVVDSLRRVKYVTTLAGGRSRVSADRADTSSPLFDPLRGAIFHLHQGNFDEACWLVFLLTHFGKHRTAGWRYVQEVYGALGEGEGWPWTRVSENPNEFRNWLRPNVAYLTRGAGRGFGNHRKYLSMSADKPSGTGAAVVSYVGWVTSSGGHERLFQDALAITNNSPERSFDRLYRSMSAVISFGRMGKFDYLTMIGKLGIASIKPGSPYIADSTGPADGARVLFQEVGAPALTGRQLDEKVVALARLLAVGMQEMEDAICNWQKSPTTYLYFGG